MTEPPRIHTPENAALSVRPRSVIFYSTFGRMDFARENAVAVDCGPRKSAGEANYGDRARLWGNAVQNLFGPLRLSSAGGVPAYKTRSMIQLTPVLTPHGALVLTEADDGWVLDADRSARLQRTFARGSGHGLLSLGVDDAGAILPPAFSWWRDFAARFAAALCASQSREENGAAVRSRAT